MLLRRRPAGRARNIRGRAHRRRNRTILRSYVRVDVRRLAREAGRERRRPGRARGVDRAGTERAKMGRLRRNIFPRVVQIQRRDVRRLGHFGETCLPCRARCTQPLSRASLPDAGLSKGWNPDEIGRLLPWCHAATARGTLKPSAWFGTVDRTVSEWWLKLFVLVLPVRRWLLSKQSGASIQSVKPRSGHQRSWSSGGV